MMISPPIRTKIVTRFIGRKEELRSLGAALHSDAPNIMLVC